MSFIQVLFFVLSVLEHDMDFGQGQVMEFPRHVLGNDGISIGFGFVFTQPNCRQKDMRKYMSHFLQGPGFELMSAE